MGTIRHVLASVYANGHQILDEIAKDAHEDLATTARGVVLLERAGAIVEGSPKGYIVFLKGKPTLDDALNGLQDFDIEEPLATVKLTADGEARVARLLDQHATAVKKR